MLRLQPNQSSNDLLETISIGFISMWRHFTLTLSSQITVMMNSVETLLTFTLPNPIYHSEYESESDFISAQQSKTYITMVSVLTKFLDY